MSRVTPKRGGGSFNVRTLVEGSLSWFIIIPTVSIIVGGFNPFEKY